MKRHCFNSLREFYTECLENPANNPDHYEWMKRDSKNFMGLSNPEIIASKYGYPVGVEKLASYKLLEVKKDVKVKYYNQFDGHDIDIDRMMENLDFLIDFKKVNQRPKTMDVYVNIAELADVDYESMLNKTWAAVSIVDQLETLGVRCAVYSIMAAKISGSGEHFIVEVCLKNHADAMNIGAICTGISPWMLRYWRFLHTLGHYPKSKITQGISYSVPITGTPGYTNGIIIDHGQCLNKTEANSFIEKIQL